MSGIFIGTSGWNYKHWKNVFYPGKMPSSQWLDYYTRYFNTVELNVTFYRLVKRETFKHWHQYSPPHFYFVAKGSRFITHIKKLKSVARPLDIFLRNAAYLKEKLLAILWQFPPNFQKNTGKLDIFLKLLSRKTKVRQVFEFRHASWFDQEIYDVLKKYNACLCIAHSDRHPCVRVITADFLYLRFHGSSLYQGDYAEGQLKEWAGFARTYKQMDLLAYFNNDAMGFAVKNALVFKKIIKVVNGNFIFH